jgi:hypothetical protein
MLLDTMFSTLGDDCETWLSLFASDAQYYHQHSGFDQGHEELLQGCQGYGSFCPAGGSCKFQQSSGASFTSRADGTCMMLVPYLWAQNPAADANLEPHTGWEYIIATPDAGSAYGYTINLFAEVETSYSVALNWGQPDDIASYEWTLDLLQATGFWEQCATSPAPVLTDFFMSNAMVSDDIYRQQGAAVLLASGDYCFAVAPYAAQVNGVDREGHFLFKMSPSDGSYELLEAVDFARTDLGNNSNSSGLGVGYIVLLSFLGTVAVVASVIVCRSLKNTKPVESGVELPESQSKSGYHLMD